MTLLDLPGTYSLRGRSPDEEITRDVVLGRYRDEAVPDLVLVWLMPPTCAFTFRLVLELKRTGRPMMLVLNMIDIAQRRGVTFDLDKLSQELGLPVVTSIAVRKHGIEELLKRTDAFLDTSLAPARAFSSEVDTGSREENASEQKSSVASWTPPTIFDLKAAQREADRIIRTTVTMPVKPDS